MAGSRTPLLLPARVPWSASLAGRRSSARLRSSRFVARMRSIETLRPGCWRMGLPHRSDQDFAAGATASSAGSPTWQHDSWPGASHFVAESAPTERIWRVRGHPHPPVPSAPGGEALSSIGTTNEKDTLPSSVAKKPADRTAGGGGADPGEPVQAAELTAGRPTKRTPPAPPVRPALPLAQFAGDEVTRAH